MQRNRSATERFSGATRLALLAVATAVLWLAVLPFVGREPGVRRFIERNESLGIDPSAKFYTELPAMPAIVERVEAARRRSDAQAR